MIAFAPKIVVDRISPPSTGVERSGGSTLWWPGHGNDIDRKRRPRPGHSCPLPKWKLWTSEAPCRTATATAPPGRTRATQATRSTRAAFVQPWPLIMKSFSPAIHHQSAPQGPVDPSRDTAQPTMDSTSVKQSVMKQVLAESNLANARALIEVCVLAPQEHASVR